MRHLLLFAHLLGFVLWMGGGLAAMQLGFLMRGAPRTELASLHGIQSRQLRVLVLPGVVLVVLSGLLLTLRLYGSATATAGYPPALMVMQGAGLLAAGVALVVTLPNATRLSRLDPVGAQAPLFDALRKRSARGGMITGLLAMVALISGVLLR